MVKALYNEIQLYAGEYGEFVDVKLILLCNSGIMLQKSSSLCHSYIFFLFIWACTCLLFSRYCS